MLDWLKNIGKEYPAFWKNYLATFEKKPSRYISISIETTGLNPKNDVILSIGAVAIINNSIVVNDLFEVAIPQYKYLHDNKLSNDFLLENSQPKMVENQAIEKFIDYLGNSIIVGHRVNFDIEMLNEVLEKLNCGRIKNEAIDVEVMYKKLHDINDKNFSLDELSQLFKIEKYDRVSTTDDAYTIGLLFLKLKSRLGIKP